MAELKMPEINNIILAGNLTKDPVFRSTSNNTPVVNFHIAANRRYRDSGNNWQEDVCYVGVVAWNKLANSCKDKLQKGSAVLVDGELQSKVFRSDDGNRTIVEIKAKRIQFLNKIDKAVKKFDTENKVSAPIDKVVDPSTDKLKTDSKSEDFEMKSFDKFLTDEETDLINNQE